jgi:hypothetical protein
MEIEPTGKTDGLKEATSILGALTWKELSRLAKLCRVTEALGALQDFKAR